MAQQITLQRITAQTGQEALLAGGLDAFRDNAQVQRLTQRHDDLGMSFKVKDEETGAYEVRQENTGADGLATAREFKPDLILLDVTMPDMNGGDVALQIEADRNLKNTPIVFLTGSAPNIAV